MRDRIRNPSAFTVTVLFTSLFMTLACATLARASQHEGHAAHGLKATASATQKNRAKTARKRATKKVAKSEKAKAGKAKADESKMGESKMGESKTEAAHYACPMHPDMTSDAPGTCDKCLMPLERAQWGDGDGAGDAAAPPSHGHDGAAQSHGHGTSSVDEGDAGKASPEKVSSKKEGALSKSPR